MKLFNFSRTYKKALYTKGKILFAFCKRDIVQKFLIKMTRVFILFFCLITAEHENHKPEFFFTKDLRFVLNFLFSMHRNTGNTNKIN